MNMVETPWSGKLMKIMRNLNSILDSSTSPRLKIRHVSCKLKHYSLYPGPVMSPLNWLTLGAAAQPLCNQYL